MTSAVRYFLLAIAVLIITLTSCNRLVTCNGSRWNHDFKVYINGNSQLVDGEIRNIDAKSLPSHILKYFNNESSGPINFERTKSYHFVTENPTTKYYRIGNCELDIKRPYEVIQQVEFENPKRWAVIFRRKNYSSFIFGDTYRTYVLNNSGSSSCYRIVHTPKLLDYEISINYDSSKVVFFEDASKPDFEKATAVLVDEAGSCLIYENEWDWIYVDPVGRP